MIPMIKSLTLALALAALVGAGLFSLLNTAGIMSVDKLEYLHRTQPVTVTGKIVSINMNRSYVVLTLVGDDGFEVVALINRTRLEALYGPVTPSNFDPNVVVTGIYDPSTKTIYVNSVLRGCHTAYSQPAASTN